MSSRHFSPLDQLIGVVDTGLRTVFSTPHAQRPTPANTAADNPLTDADKQLAGRLMRINHAGEVAAQGLYQGQALTAKMPNVRDKMQQAAEEENDHLNWCAGRIKELDSHTSYLDPVWYLGSLTIGAIAGAIGDKWSLGFVAETEKQVVAHLDSHLDKLDEQDEKTRAILKQMKEDELHHATTALEAGGADLPLPIRGLMKLTAKVMTKTAYWV